jgi:hypothetical protein
MVSSEAAVTNAMSDVSTESTSSFPDLIPGQSISKIEVLS